MLKDSKTNLNNIIRELELETRSKIAITKMSKYAESNKQKVAVCLHPSSYICGYHSHDFYEVNFVLKGSCINLIEGQNITMESGDMILIHPGAFHTLYTDNSCKVFNFLVDSEWFLTETERLFPSSSIFYDFIKESRTNLFYKYAYLPATQSMTDTARTLIAQTHSTTSPTRYILAEALMLKLITQMLENEKGVSLSSGRGQSHNKIISILDFLSNNFKTVDLNQVCEKFFYSKTHVCRLFLNSTGKTFKQTLVDLRINKACNYLKTTDMIIENVALAVGYDSVEYFQRLFKKNVGMSPGEYRKLYKSK